MARTAFRAQITTGGTYTVPAGKTAVFKAFVLEATNGSGGGVAIGGVTCASVIYVAAATFILTAGPLTANAGEVISSTTASGASGAYGISGFLYDN